MAVAASEAIERLKKGNALYLDSDANHGDISRGLIEELWREGQAPYACIVSCADSRVVPEHIFMTGLGELFCIRVAGNAIGAMELASCVYAAEHLGVQLIVVLGHTNCGAVGAALEALGTEAPAEGTALSPLVSAIADAIGDERDPEAASAANARAGVAALSADPEIAHLVDAGKLSVVGALYRTKSGKVDFLD